MSSQNEILNSTLRQAFGQAYTSALAVRSEQRDATLPPGDVYAAVKVIDVTTFGTPSVEVSAIELSTDAEETIGEYQHALLSLNVYSRNFDPATNFHPVDFLQYLRIWLWSQEGFDLLKSKNLGYVDAGAVRDLTELEETTWEARGQMDVTLSLVNEYVLTRGTIGTIPITGTYESAEETYGYDFSVEES